MRKGQLNKCDLSVRLKAGCRYEVQYRETVPHIRTANKKFNARFPN